MLNETLRLLRVLHDMTATELAKELGISVAQLSKIEQGKATPQMALIEKYAKLFQTTPAALMLFAQDLDEKKNRSKFKLTIRNIMFKLLKMLGGLETETDDKKNINNKKSII